MIRESSPPRRDWREVCEAAGLTFHTEGGIPYWDESVRYRFTLAQIEDDLEGPTGDLMAMCYAAIDGLIGDPRALDRLGIPPDFRSAIATSMAGLISPITGAAPPSCLNSMPIRPPRCLNPLLCSGNGWRI
jgi:glutathionylspermidine synthase